MKEHKIRIPPSLIASLEASEALSGPTEAQKKQAQKTLDELLMHIVPAYRSAEDLLRENIPASQILAFQSRHSISENGLLIIRFIRGDHISSSLRVSDRDSKDMSDIWDRIPEGISAGIAITKIIGDLDSKLVASRKAIGIHLSGYGGGKVQVSYETDFGSPMNDIFLSDDIKVDLSDDKVLPLAEAGKVITTLFTTEEITQEGSIIQALFNQYE